MNVGIVSLTDIDYGLDLANALCESGVSVSLYMSRSHTARAVGDLVRPVERIYELGLLPPAVSLHLFDAPRMRDPRSLNMVRKLSLAIHKEGVDLVHILTGSGELWMAALACLLRGLPVVSTMREPIANVGDRIPASVVSAVNRLLTYGANVIIVNGANHVAQVQAIYRVPPNQISYISLGPRTTAAKWISRIVPEEPGMILFFGRVDRHKGLEYLIQAQPNITNRVPYARIVIAGNGKEELERCRQMMRDSTRFEIYAGFVPNDVAAELFQRASVVVLPYISASTSGVLMTAYVFGKPVVVTQVGSLPEYVHDGETGFVVPTADSEKLANALVRILSDDALRHRMGQNAAQWVSEEKKRIARESLRVYEKAINAHKPMQNLIGD